jgi:hypothetical protein
VHSFQAIDAGKLTNISAMVILGNTPESQSSSILEEITSPSNTT